MSLSGIFGQIVAWIGAALILLRRRDGAHEPAMGSAPAIPAARPQGIPTLKMPTAQGWTPGQTPVAAPGLRSMRLQPVSGIRAGSTSCPMAASWSPRP